MVNLITFDAVYMTCSKSKILDGKADNFMCLGKKIWFKKCLGIFLLRPGTHCWPEFVSWVSVWWLPTDAACAFARRLQADDY